METIEMMAKRIVDARAVGDYQVPKHLEPRIRSLPKQAVAHGLGGEHGCSPAPAAFSRLLSPTVSCPRWLGRCRSSAPAHLFDGGEPR